MSQFLDPRLQKMTPYQPGKQPKERSVIKLNTNESPFPPASGVESAVVNTAKKLRLYPDLSHTAVKKTLAAQMGVGVDQIMLGNGSDEILAFCFQALCPSGAAFPDLTYGFYPVYADLYGVNAKIIPLAKDFTITVSDYAGINRTIFIANPNAPTGLALSLDEIETLLRSNPASLVVIDEAYVHFGAQSAVSLLTKYDNLLVVGTFSKSRSLAGARLGYAVASATLIADLERIRFSFNPYNVNAMTLAAGEASLLDIPYFKNCCQKIVQTRTRSLQEFKALGFITTESIANFIFVSHAAIEAQYLQQQLQNAGILVRWFNIPRIKNYLRITIGTDAQMDKLLAATKEILITEKII